MSDPSGTLKIQLIRQATGADCRIESSRPLNAARLFLGRSLVDTARRLPLLYSICAKAQALACVTALEQASGITVTVLTRARRQRLVALETLREHLWRVLLDWPANNGEPPRRGAMTAILEPLRALSSLQDPRDALFLPGGQACRVDANQQQRLVAQLRALVAEHLFGMPAEDWLAASAVPATLQTWCEQTNTAAAGLLRRLLEQDEAGVGASGVQALPPLSDAALASAMRAAEQAGFLARPTWDGMPRETSALTRQAAQAGLAVWRARYGNGLLPRLLAQLIEIARLLAGLEGGGEGEVDQDADPHRTPPADGADPLAPGLGLGRVEAARGLLLHLAAVADGEVQDYRILAPTEWNFHPQGAVAAGLASLEDAADDQLRRRAELLILAVDPCVAFDLQILPAHA